MINRLCSVGLLILILSGSVGGLKLAEILKSLRWNSVNVVQSPNTFRSMSRFLDSSSFGIQFKIMDQNTIVNVSRVCSYTAVPTVFLLDQHVSMLNLIKQCLQFKLSESVLVVLEKNARDVFVQEMEMFNHSKSLFVWNLDDPGFKLIYTSIGRQVLVWNDIQPIWHPYQTMNIDRNLQGLVLRDISLTWMPWLEITCRNGQVMPT